MGLFFFVLLAAPPASLDDARRDEVEVLGAERDALRRAIDDAKGASTTATRALDTEVESLADGSQQPPRLARPPPARTSKRLSTSTGADGGVAAFVGALGFAA